MYILNGLASFCNFFYRGAKAIVGGPRQATRNSAMPLMHQHSLTADFVGYEHSNRALLTCMMHTVIYYVLAVILFNYTVEHWGFFNSLYYATVLVSRCRS